MPKQELDLYPQQQLTDTSCVPACIAIVTGIDQQLIIDEMMHYSGNSRTLQDEFYQWVRLRYYPQEVKWNRLTHGGLYLATVPSLNNSRANHRVVVDMREDMRVLDPNEGRVDKKSYDHESLTAWSSLTTVVNCRGV